LRISPNRKIKADKQRQTHQIPERDNRLKYLNDSKNVDRRKNVINDSCRGYATKKTKQMNLKGRKLQMYLVIPDFINI